MDEGAEMRVVSRQRGGFARCVVATCGSPCSARWVMFSPAVLPRGARAIVLLSIPGARRVP
eukprot:10056281-Lingulodinium_polyedra.AAC.1